ncbi:hypothetical protein Mapa_012064 [Marchantia paleacea]|nr:hypothetical protein Mapa_012064 [Marchantia paleacea]
MVGGHVNAAQLLVSGLVLQYQGRGDEPDGILAHSGMPDDCHLLESLSVLIGGDGCADLLGCGVDVLDQGHALDEPLSHPQDG